MQKKYQSLKLHIVVIFGLLFSIHAFSQEKSIFDIARKGSLAELKVAIKNKPDIINTISKEGYSSLTLACYHGNNEVAKYLIEHVKDIDSKSGYGTPLMAATVKKNLELVKLLLKHKANPNSVDQNGSTALHFSVIFSYDEIVKLLVDANAKVNLKDNRGKTALDYAKVTQNETITKILNNN
jgi:ankyrin repeat protein